MMVHSSNPNITVYADLLSLSKAAADEVVQAAQVAIAARGRFVLSLAGGNTPRRLYQLLAGEYRERIDWSRVHLLWGDERCVPPDDPGSNYRMAYEALIADVPIPADNVHRMPAELTPPMRAADAYTQELATVFGDSVSVPVFDLILLGTGADGHTASLFPDNPALEEDQRWVVAVVAPPSYEQRDRISLTFPVLNIARHVLFLVAGADKQHVVQAIAHPSEATPPYPAARVRPHGTLQWFVDQAAAP